MTNDLAIYFDEPFDQQKEEMLEQDWVQANPGRIMEGCEIIPSKARGLGRSPASPIPVNGIRGTYAYLNRLRSASGASFFYHRAMSTRGMIDGHRVDLYELVAVDGSCWDFLYVDMYFFRRTTLAPEGLTMVPLGSLPRWERVFVHDGHQGVNFNVPNFPLGLPTALRQADIDAADDAGYDSDIEPIYANRVEDLLMARTVAQWRRPCPREPGE